MNFRFWLSIAAALAALAALAFFAFDNKLTLRQYTVQTRKLTSPVRLAVIADLHSCGFGNDQDELLALVRAQQPDAILFAGDILDDVLPPEPALLALETLAGEYPCYYVSGNHEVYCGALGQIKRAVEKRGVKVLDGDADQLRVRGETITICGVGDPAYGKEHFSSQLASAAYLADFDRFSILLAHRPERIADYCAFPYDLVISGHAHGGQWRLPGLINGLYAPNQGLFPKYAGGVYPYGDASLVVSRGLSLATHIPRVFNPPELVCVDIKPIS